MSSTSPTTTPECGCTSLVRSDTEMKSNSVRISSSGSSYTGPEEARLNNQPSASGSGAWEPKDENGYLIINFGKELHIDEIRTQGSPSSDKYTTAYYLFYSTDGINFDTVNTVSLFVIKVF